MGNSEKHIEFLKRLLDGAENSNFAAQQAAKKAYETAYPSEAKESAQ